VEQQAAQDRGAQRREEPFLVLAESPADEDYTSDPPRGGQRRAEDHPLDGRRAHLPRSLSGYWDGPRFERRGAGCEAPRRSPLREHRRGAARTDAPPRRRNPPGARVLRAYAASLVVDDAPAALSASLLAAASQARGARA